MTRRSLLLAAVVALISLAAAACGSTETALRVGDTTISRSELLDELEARGDLVDGVAPTDAAVRYLTSEVQQALVRVVAEREGIAVDISNGTEAEDAFAEITAAEIERRVPGIREVAAESSTCSRHILLDSTDEAEEILTQLQGGADFATLAQQLSTDVSTGAAGGDLGCGPQGRFVPEFEAALLAADTGVPVGPVESQFGFHIIEKLPFVADPNAIFEAGFETAFTEENSYNEWFDASFADIEVEVDPRYGAWNLDDFRVIAPEG